MPICIYCGNPIYGLTKDHLALYGQVCLVMNKTCRIQIHQLCVKGYNDSALTSVGFCSSVEQYQRPTKCEQKKKKKKGVGNIRSSVCHRDGCKDDLNHNPFLTAFSGSCSII